MNKKAMPFIILAIWLGMVIFSNRKVLGIVSLIYGAVKVA